MILVAIELPVDVSNIIQILRLFVEAAKYRFFEILSFLLQFTFGFRNVCPNICLWRLLAFLSNGRRE